MKHRRKVIGVVAAVATLAAAVWLFRFPADTTPKGAYMRIARAISDDEPGACFAYLEEDAQHAAFTIIDYASKASDTIRKAYPEPARSETLARYEVAAAADGGADLFARYASQRGWIGRLRRDLSGVADVQIDGERATVVTVRGTRYPFRRRPNGIWGLTMFTADLVAEAERMARDWELIQRDAADYRRAEPETGP